MVILVLQIRKKNSISERSCVQWDKQKRFAYITRGRKSKNAEKGVCCSPARLYSNIYVYPQNRQTLELISVARTFFMLLRLYQSVNRATIYSMVPFSFVFVCPFVWYYWCWCWLCAVWSRLFRSHQIHSLIHEHIVLRVNCTHKTQRRERNKKQIRNGKGDRFYLLVICELWTYVFSHSQWLYPFSFHTHTHTLIGNSVFIITIVISPSSSMFLTKTYAPNDIFMVFV